MNSTNKALISIVLPLYNEQNGIEAFHQSLVIVLSKIKDFKFEIIYVNDGSNDTSIQKLRDIADQDDRVKVISLSRNFGKEIATTAGIELAKGRAVITLDSDGQHPVEKIPKFIKQWQTGAKVVIGMRQQSKNHATIFKRLSSSVFYKLFNKLSGVELIKGATDYRLIDKVVRDDFVKLTERNRITRGLIDWLGYERSFISYQAKPRLRDDVGYSFTKLAKLALDSLISLSNSPLYAIAYIGIVVLPLSVLIGLAMIIDKLFGDPFHWRATGGAYLIVLELFLLGLILMSQGLIGLYLSHIHNETQNRPLYIIDQQASIKLK